MVKSIFGVEWEALTLADVEAFLADAGDEGLTWEAKGTERPHPNSVRKNACAFANAIGGGFYLVGVRRDGTEWVADGVAFDGAEPAPWLGNIIRAGLNPVPRYDVQAWEVDGGKHVAVVRIDPVPEPPCMTTSGEVFERVSGESPKVTDPVVLAGLRQRGDAAEAAAEGAALSEGALVGFADPGKPPFLIVTFALAPVGISNDIAARLFTTTFEELIRKRTEALPSAAYVQTYSTQDAVLASTDTTPLGWKARAAWNGAVAVLFQVMHPDPAEERWTRMTFESLFDDRVAPASRAAVALAAAIGGDGRAHTALRVGGRGFSLVYGYSTLYPAPAPTNLRPIQRWTGADGEVTDDMLESMKRELMRAVGARTWEPEPEPP